MCHSECRRGVSLRIEVDDQHFSAEIGESGCQVHGRGGLSDAALLVRHREDAGVTTEMHFDRLQDSAPG